jgi:predicted amidohydrolase
MSALRVAAIQHDIVWEDPPANFERLAPRIAEAAAGGARLAVLTEMCATGFSMDSERIAEEPDGPSTAFLVEHARTHGIWLAGSVPERTPGLPLPTNTLVLAAPDGTVHRYAKLHPFTYAGEDEHYAAGDRHVTVDVEGVRVSLFVCYDLRFADELWAVARDTDLYLVVANWPESRREHWRVLLRARAIENQAYVVGVNRVGRGGKLEYVGDSRVIGPMGKVLAEAPPDGGKGVETVLTAEIDPARVAETRQKFPFLADRRP